MLVLATLGAMCIGIDAGGLQRFGKADELRRGETLEQSAAGRGRIK